MNRQEYQEKLLCVKTDNVGLKLMEGIKIRNEYIDSLESENEQLKAENAQLREDNATLIEQFGAVAQKLDHALVSLGEFAPCPSLEVLKKECVATCKECWAIYLEEKCQK